MKMRIAIIDVGEEHSQYVGQVYQEHYGKLHHYFLALLGDASEADACVQETIRRFFFFMEDRCWESDMEYMPVYLMRIAGMICSKKLAGKQARRKRLGDNKVLGLFDKIRIEIAQFINEHITYSPHYLRYLCNIRKCLCCTKLSNS